MKVIDKFIKTLRVSPCSSVAVAILVTSFFTFCIVPAMIGALVFDLPPYLSSVMGAFLFLIFICWMYAITGIILVALCSSLYSHDGDILDWTPALYLPDGGGLNDKRRISLSR